MTLKPGDVILTGFLTQCRRLTHGDEFNCRVQGNGELKNPVIAAKKLATLIINWSLNDRFPSNYPLQDFTGLSGALLNRDLMPATIMSDKFLSEIHKPPAQIITRQVGYSSVCQEE